MELALRAAVVACAYACCSPAYAQADAYHHRSTVPGDILSGAADLEAANGLATKHRAQAYEHWMSGEERRLLLQYQLYDIRRQIADNEAETRRRKAENRLQRLAENEVKSDQAARAMVTRLQLGVYEWPEALRRREYASSMRTVESILLGWGQSTSGLDVYARRALATEAGVLRSRLAANREISDFRHLEAVKALKLVQRLAAMDAAARPGTKSLAAW